MSIGKKIWILWLVACASSVAWTGVRAQPAPAEAYRQTDLPARPFDRAQWQDLIRELDYSEPGKAPARNRASREKRNRGLESPPPKRNEWDLSWIDSPWLSVLTKLFLLLSGAVLLFFLLRGLLGLQWGPRNRKISRADDASIDIKRVEENPEAFDIEALIRQARADENYALALRLHYLRLLRECARLKLIRRKREKTNQDYLNELHGSPYYEPFRQLTYLFDRVWYGEKSLDRTGYQAIEPKFQSMYEQLQNQPEASATEEVGAAQNDYST